MTIPTTADIRRPTGAQPADGDTAEELRGRVAGSIVCAVMGLTWAASGVGDLSPAVAVPVLLASVAISATLLAGSRRLRRAATATPASTSPGAEPGRVRRRFNLAVAVEFVVIAAAVNILVRSGHAQWIPATICAVVGLHFVPLARLFRVGLYNATAVALCVVALVTMVLGAAGAPAMLWRLLPGFGAALALWATGASLLGVIPGAPSQGWRR